MAFSGSSIAILFIGAAVYAAAGPVQLHGGSSTVQRDDYGSPALAELLARYWEDRSAGRNLDGVGGGHSLRQARRVLDSLAGTTFGESKRLSSFRRPGPTNIRSAHNFDEIDRSVFDRFSKRNIDEIDNAFDSFFKRNLDEIDRVGWSGFVKRLDNYLADRQRR
nr:PREDICTED: orcokinin peptides type A-like isoform X2 [Linepithema humile]